VSTNFFQRPLIPQNPNPEPPEFPLLRDMLFRRIALMQSDPYGGQTFSSGGRGTFDPYGGGYMGGGMGGGINPSGTASPAGGISSVLNSLMAGNYGQGGGGMGGGAGSSAPRTTTVNATPHESANNPNGSDAEFEKGAKPRDEEAHRHAPANTTPSYAGTPAGPPPNLNLGLPTMPNQDPMRAYDIENWFASGGPKPSGALGPPPDMSTPTRPNYDPMRAFNVENWFAGAGAPASTAGAAAIARPGATSEGSAAPGPSAPPTFGPPPSAPPNFGGPAGPHPNTGPSWNPKMPSFSRPSMPPGFGPPNPNPPMGVGPLGGYHPLSPPSGPNYFGADAMPAYAAMGMMRPPRPPMMHPAAMHNPRPIMQMLLARGVHPRPQYAAAPSFSGGAPMEGANTPGPGLAPRGGSAPTPTPVPPSPAPTPTPAPTPSGGSEPIGGYGPPGWNPDFVNPDYGRNETNPETGKKPQPGGAK
jgi:hypothetical protein